MDINQMAKEIHENAIAHGWWEEPRGFGEIIALCHSELSEALEEYRRGHAPTETYYTCTRAKNRERQWDCRECDYSPEVCPNRKAEGIAVELADCIIRILDWCGREGVDIEQIIREKHEYNKGRSYKHGGKVI